MNDCYCDNCSCRLTGEEEFCPECDILIQKFKAPDEDYYICPVCASKNATGEKKCNNCCSII